MKKTWILVSIFIIFFSNYSLAKASLMINEIMYDVEGADEGREWVEVYNSGPEVIDLPLYKFFESDTNHKLVLVQGSPKIEAQGYAVIVSDPVKFKASVPNFSGNIFDSSFSLSNVGEALAIKDKDLNTVDEVTYSSSMGGLGNGKTISKIDGVWKEGIATPGAVNQVYVPPVKLISSSASAPKKETNVVQDKTENKAVAEIAPESVIKEIPFDHTNKDVEVGSVNFPVLITALIFVMGGGAIAVYFLRKKKIVPANSSLGEDFNILDE